MCLLAFNNTHSSNTTSSDKSDNYSELSVPFTDVISWFDPHVYDEDTFSSKLEEEITISQIKECLKEEYTNIKMPEIKSHMLKEECDGNITFYRPPDVHKKNIKGD